MNWFLSRLNEPSTHAAVAGVVGSLLPLVPPQYQWIAQILALGFGGAGVIKAEAK